MPSLNHLHLHVRDVEASKAFYGRWFGLREHVRHGDLLFVKDRRDFHLALAPDRAPARLPRWFHLGFRLGDAGKVRALHRRMRAARVACGDLGEVPGYVSFRLKDPDGYVIEVYWE